MPDDHCTFRASLQKVQLAVGRTETAWNDQVVQKHATSADHIHTTGEEVARHWLATVGCGLSYGDEGCSASLAAGCSGMDVAVLAATTVASRVAHARASSEKSALLHDSASGASHATSEPMGPHGMALVLVLDRRISPSAVPIETPVLTEADVTHTLEASSPVTWVLLTMVVGVDSVWDPPVPG